MTVQSLPGGIRQISVRNYLRKIPRGVKLLKVNHEEPRRNRVIGLGDEVTLGMASIEANHRADAVPLY